MTTMIITRKRCEGKSPHTQIQVAHMHINQAITMCYNNYNSRAGYLTNPTDFLLDFIAATSDLLQGSFV